MLLDGIPHNHPFISNALRVMCFSKTYLTETANSIVKDGGEGVILRKPGSRYEKGRSDNLFKFKAARSDREALVLRSTPNQYFVLQLTDGRTIRAQCKTFPKGKGPKRGDVVTFEYDSVSRVGVPVNPVISRVRRDVEWQDIVKKGGEAQSNLNAPSSKAMGLESRYAYHWPLEKLKGRRLFFEKFALARGFDPLVAKNWYRISRKAVENTEGGSAVLSHYNGSVIKALLSLFPGIGLEKTKFSILPKKYWLPIENRRKFFLDFAKQKKFDPFVASNWYSVKMSTFLKSKGGFSVLEFHNGSLITALSHLFPEIKFSESDPKTAKFDELEKRDFFLSFAKNKKFDSLVPDNWYIHAGEIPSIKGARVIIHEYGGDVVRALLRLFPSMGLEKDKLYSAYGNYWRKRLHEFSLDNSFDPLIPDNWYHMTREKELTIFNQDTKELLKFPRDLVIKEILNHFPYIGLEKSKFAYLSDKYNLNDNARKKFFERVAKLKGFDPNIAENWYSVTRWDVMQVKGASAVLRYYNGSYIKALTALFPDLSLKPLKFPSLSRNHWRDPSRRRAFLDAFAKKHNFDALQWNEWEKISIRDICSEKGGSSVLKRYNFSLIQTLKDLYPDMKPSADYLVTGAGGRRKKVRNKG